MDISAAMMPLAVVGTVVLMPLITPLLFPGVSVSSFALAKQLVLTVLLPLVGGVLMRVYASQVADKILPYFKKLAGLTTLALLVFTVVMYGRELLAALGSFAVASQVLFVLITALGAYAFGFGMKQSQRSAFTLEHFAECRRLRVSWLWLPAAVFRLNWGWNPLSHQKSKCFKFAKVCERIRNVETNRSHYRRRIGDRGGHISPFFGATL